MIIVQRYIEYCLCHFFRYSASLRGRAVAESRGVVQCSYLYEELAGEAL